MTLGYQHRCGGDKLIKHCLHGKQTSNMTARVDVTSRCASAAVKLHQPNRLVVGACCYEVAVTVPRHTVDGTLVMFDSLHKHVHWLHRMVRSIQTQQQRQ